MPNEPRKSGVRHRRRNANGDFRATRQARRLVGPEPSHQPTLHWGDRLFDLHIQRRQGRNLRRRSRRAHACAPARPHRSGSRERVRRRSPTGLGTPFLLVSHGVPGTLRNTRGRESRRRCGRRFRVGGAGEGWNAGRVFPARQASQTALLPVVDGPEFPGSTWRQFYPGQRYVG